MKFATVACTSATIFIGIRSSGPGTCLSIARGSSSCDMHVGKYSSCSFGGTRA